MSSVVSLGEIKCIVSNDGKYKGTSTIVYADGHMEVVSDKRADQIAKTMNQLDKAAHNLREHRDLSGNKYEINPITPSPMVQKAASHLTSKTSIARKK